MLTKKIKIALLPDGSFVWVNFSYIEYFDLMRRQKKSIDDLLRLSDETGKTPNEILFEWKNNTNTL